MTMLQLNWKWVVMSAVMLGLWWLTGSLIGFIVAMVVVVIDLLVMVLGLTRAKTVNAWDIPFWFIVLGIPGALVVLAVQHLR